MGQKLSIISGNFFIPCMAQMKVLKYAAGMIAGISILAALWLAVGVRARVVLDRERSVETAAGSWSMWPRFIWQILTSPVMKKQFGD